MAASKFSKDLERGRTKFQAWRRGQSGGRIPLPLWALAVRLARRHGLSRTAAALGLAYSSLKKRADAAPSTSPLPSHSPAFVELQAPVLVSKHCVFELESGAEATRRVQLVGYDLAEIEALARTFWDGR